MDERCGTCRFWVEWDDKEELIEEGEWYGGLRGHCHRHAPRPDRGDPNTDALLQESLWPNTYNYQWCGDWEELSADVSSS